MRKTAGKYGEKRGALFVENADGVVAVEETGAGTYLTAECGVAVVAPIDAGQDVVAFYVGIEGDTGKLPLFVVGLCAQGKTHEGVFAVDVYFVVVEMLGVEHEIGGFDA